MLKIKYSAEKGINQKHGQQCTIYSFASRMMMHSRLKNIFNIVSVCVHDFATSLGHLGLVSSAMPILDYNLPGVWSCNYMYPEIVFTSIDTMVIRNTTNTVL